MTTREPGASDVFTVGPTLRPRATAFRASRPAPTITVGFEVLVHEVMAAMATEPERMTALLPPTSTDTEPFSVAPVVPPSSVRRDSSAAVEVPGAAPGNESRKFAGRSGSGTRSWGRRGPATDGTTVARSSSRVASKSGPGPGSRHRPWARA